MERNNSNDPFLASGRSLEDAFFLEQDRKLIARKIELRKMAETKEALAAASGIQNQTVLQRLVELNVRPETLAAMAVVPLVEIVWADGKVDAEERKTVLAHATTKGITAGSIEYELLEQWLNHRPEPTLFDAWQHYVTGLCEQMSPADRESLKKELLHFVREAAESSGGVLGFGKVSAEEKKVLAKLESSFFCA